MALKEHSNLLTFLIGSFEIDIHSPSYSDKKWLLFDLRMLEGETRLIGLFRLRCGTPGCCQMLHPRGTGTKMLKVRETSDIGLTILTNPAAACVRAPFMGCPGRQPR